MMHIKSMALERHSMYQGHFTPIALEGRFF
jgi:hypothetical protein